MTCLGAGFVSLITTLFGNFRNKRTIKKEEFYLFIEMKKSQKEFGNSYKIPKF